jgi:hypothetical protein
MEWGQIKQVFNKFMYTSVVLGRTRINVTVRGFDKAVWSLNSGISKGQMTVYSFPLALYTWFHQVNIYVNVVAKRYQSLVCHLCVLVMCQDTLLFQITCAFIKGVRK